MKYLMGEIHPDIDFLHFSLPKASTQIPELSDP